jgi:hypothetical protein
MIRGERGEAGLFQLLLAMAMSLAVLGATLTIFSGAEEINVAANKRTDTDDAARNTLDMIARQLRDLASPTAEQPDAVDKATAYDIVFETVDPVGPNSADNTSNIERVRYCLGGTPGAATLYRQAQRWTSATPPGLPGTSACPSSVPAWSSSTPVAWGITNQAGGQDRPLFTYDAQDTSEITLIHAALYLDSGGTHSPGETALSTGVFLRNQNRKPDGSFTADNAVPGKIVLNGSTSEDPEGEPLDYEWYDSATHVGSGIRFDYAVASGSVHTITLKVYDPAGLEGDSDPQTVTAR